MTITKDERRKQLSEFLRTRRARLTPAEVGLPVNGRRRTPGLRREEVAFLAGVGVDWYTWLEQGRDINASEQVLTSIARILKLDPAETKHLFTLAYTQNAAPREEVVSPILQSLLDSQPQLPMAIIGRRWDTLAWNRGLCTIMCNFDDLAPGERNMMWQMFTNSPYRETLVDWEHHAQHVIAQFRADYGAFPDDQRFQELIKRLNAASPEFREWWPRHDVGEKSSRRKEIRHPLVGLLSFEQNTFQSADRPELRMVVMVPIPETPTSERMKQLVEYAAVNAL